MKWPAAAALGLAALMAGVVAAGRRRELPVVRAAVSAVGVLVVVAAVIGVFVVLRV